VTQLVAADKHKTNQLYVGKERRLGWWIQSVTFCGGNMYIYNFFYFLGSASEAESGQSSTTSAAACCSTPQHWNPLPVVSSSHVPPTQHIALQSCRPPVSLSYHLPNHAVLAVRSLPPILLCQSSYTYSPKVTVYPSHTP
jgi:hypothetical protein